MIVVNEALMEPERRCQSSKFFKQTPDGCWTPTCPSDPAAKPMTIVDVDPKLLKAPDVTMDDFETALKRIKPSVSDDDIKNHVRWTEYSQGV